MMTYEEQLEATIIQLEQKLDEVADKYIQTKEAYTKLKEAIKPLRISDIEYSQSPDIGVYRVTIKGYVNDAFDVAKFKEAFEDDN